jgi:hypothetical protein
MNYRKIFSLDMKYTGLPGTVMGYLVVSSWHRMMLAAIRRHAEGLPAANPPISVPYRQPEDRT